MLKFVPLNIQQNYKNILSLIESNEKNSLFEILSQDNIIQSINLPNTKISQYLFNHIADLFDIAIDIKFSKQIENQIKKDFVANQESINDHEIENSNSKIEYKDSNFFKISSNAREVLVALSIHFPAQFSENATFHEKMNQALNLINSQKVQACLENNVNTNSVDEKSNSNSESQDTFQRENNKSNFVINANIAAVLISRIIFSLGKSENYSILASLSDDHEFFPKFCSLIGTHCAVYDTLFTLSNDDMPAVSLFFEDMDTTEVLLEMIKKSIPTIQLLSKGKEKNDSALNSDKSFLNNYNVSFEYFDINDIFRMQKRALNIITHLISNAEKGSILIKNISEKYEYINFIFEDLGIKSLSKEVSASAFTLLIRLYQISSSPNVINKSSLFNPFMNSKTSSFAQQVDSDYDDDDLDYDSDYDSSENFNKMSKKKCLQNKENAKHPKKNPIKSFFDNKFDILCQYIIESKSFSTSTEKALDILCMLLHSSEIQDSYFNKTKENNHLQALIENLTDDFFRYPNCSILHTNFRKFFSLIIKIESQRLIDFPEHEQTPFIVKVCNYLKEKIIQVLISQKTNDSEPANNDLIEEQTDANDNISISKNNKIETHVQSESNSKNYTLISNLNDKDVISTSESKTEGSDGNIKILKAKNDYSNFMRYDFTKYCFWGIVVELSESIDSILSSTSITNNNDIYWSKFIQNDVKRFRYITSHEYGGTIPQSTRTYGKILCVRSPSSKSSGQKPKNISMNEVSEKLEFGNDSDED